MVAWVYCRPCGGHGYADCPFCGGDPEERYECRDCAGEGTETCDICDGEGGWYDE